MIFFVSKYLYFLLLLAFLIIVSSSKMFPWEILGENIAFIFTILLLPLIDMSIESLKKESKRINFTLTSTGLLKILFSLIILLFVYFKWVEIFSFITIWYFVLGIVFRFNSRIAFFVSLFCFAYVALFLVTDNKKAAELLSIHAYYYLIIGVIHQICNTRHEKKQNTPTSIEQ